MSGGSLAWLRGAQHGSDTPWSSAIFVWSLLSPCKALNCGWSEMSVVIHRGVQMGFWPKSPQGPILRRYPRIYRPDPARSPDDLFSAFQLYFNWWSDGFLRVTTRCTEKYPKIFWIRTIVLKVHHTSEIGQISASIEYKSGLKNFSEDYYRNIYIWYIQIHLA